MVRRKVHNTLWRGESITQSSLGPGARRSSFLHHSTIKARASWSPFHRSTTRSRRSSPLHHSTTPPRSRSFLHHSTGWARSSTPLHHSTTPAHRSSPLHHSSTRPRGKSLLHWSTMWARKHSLHHLDARALAPPMRRKALSSRTSSSISRFRVNRRSATPSRATAFSTLANCKPPPPQSRWCRSFRARRRCKPRAPASRQWRIHDYQRAEYQ